MALIGALLLLDSIALLATGRFHFGVVLPGLIGAAFLWLAWRWSALQHWRAPPAPRWRGWLWRAGWVGFFAWLASVALFFGLIGADHSVDARKTGAPAVILVLGSGTPNCAASSTLAARLDVALAQAALWPQAPVLVSGGPDFGRQCTEAGVMAEYLRARGINERRLLQEPQSTSTEENLRFSLPVMAAHGLMSQDPATSRGGPPPVLIVTSDFHALRARLIAYRAGYRQVASAGAPTPLYLRYNAWLREYFAFGSGWLLKEF
ncbi:MAG: YdcF family protein [Variovorax sp.]|nr:MAG: YdcF family protein [Variovorax sp.]